MKHPRTTRSALLALALLNAPACSGHPPPTPEARPDARQGAPRQQAPPAAEPPAPDQPAPDGVALDSPAPEPPKTPIPPEELPEGYLTFEGACDPGDTLTIAAVGDILLHEELQIQAYAADELHLALWGGVVDLLERADVTYANLEGPLAKGITRSGKTREDPGRVYDNKVYSAYPRFNFHPSLADSLVKSGVDIVSTANNHALDRHPVGVDLTLEELDRVGLAHTGTRAQGAGDETPWHAITKTKGFTLAWLACAHHTNQIVDERYQVLKCFRDNELVIKAIKRLSKKKGVDAVIVTPHWGKEYKPAPRKQQVNLAHRMAEAGATAIIGSHPHVTQPWEKYTTRDGREVFIHFSLGNFASHQTDLPRRSSLILYVGLTRTTDGVVRVNGVRYTPLHVRQDDDEFFIEAIDRVGGPEDSRALTVAMYGRHNLLAPGAALETNGHCRAGFEFPAR